MRRKKSSIAFAAVGMLLQFVAPIHTQAQYEFFNPNGSFAIEISLENSPYDNNKLPIYRNAVTSLTVLGDNIIGGTSSQNGLSPFIFVVSLKSRALTRKIDLEQAIRGQRSIATGFIKTKKGDALYAGTIPAGESASGHLFKVNVNATGEISVTDIGTPVPGEGIFALTADEPEAVLYGISYPSGIFFSHDLKSGSTKTYRDLVPGKMDKHTYREFELTPDDYLTRALVTDDKGRVYGSRPINRFFCFDPQTNKFDTLKSSVPFVWGREVMGRVDAWVKAPDGTIYGSNSGDGQLFILNAADGKITNLGKPVMMPRLRGLTFAGDGRLYGIAGGMPGYGHLISYNAKEGFRDFGNPEFQMVAEGMESPFLWRAFQMGAITTSEDGKYVVIGEDEALSQLLIFPVK